MEAAGDGGGWGLFDAQALGADGDAAVGADAGLGALAEDVGPPRAFVGGPQGAAVLLFGEVPRGLGRGADFAMDLMAVAMLAQGIDPGVGFRQGGDVFGGKEGGQAVLPEAVGALDFSLGLGSGGKAQADFVEVKGGAELGEGLGSVGEEEGVVVDVKGQGQAEVAESRSRWASKVSRG